MEERGKMLVLHNPATMLHKSKEILGSQLIDALECPERIKAIVKAIVNDGTYELVVVEGEVSSLLGWCVERSHDDG